MMIPIGSWILIPMLKNAKRGEMVYLKAQTARVPMVMKKVNPGKRYHPKAQLVEDTSAICNI
jgi:hypothetical protein